MALPRLRVSENRRYLVDETGKPFFYLADTAWELFHRLDRNQALEYLHDRAGKRFTVIQAVALAELDGLLEPTPSGHVPLHDLDPTQPDEAYFQEVDFVVEAANGLGMYVGLLPTWGDKWSRVWGKGPEVFNADNARTYGEFLGNRYRDRGVIWILGGDRHLKSPLHGDIHRAMAHGLRRGDGGVHLITFHPQGQYSSACYFHDEDWLDFNMIQTGHTRDRDNYNSVAAEFNRLPTKPIVDGEPGYENIPHAFDVAHGRLDAYQSRKFAYWSLFAGACGHTYGCNDIWQMYDEGREPVLGANMPWHQAIHLPGSSQMQHARRLIEDNGFWDRLPDQSLIANHNPSSADHRRSCRAPDGRFALLYTPTGQPVEVRLHILMGREFAASWFNPRSGEESAPETIAGEDYASHVFRPPSTGDWVLILRRTKELW